MQSLYMLNCSFFSEQKENIYEKKNLIDRMPTFIFMHSSSQKKIRTKKNRNFLQNYFFSIQPTPLKLSSPHLRHTHRFQEKRRQQRL